jgi:hypothetical protein
MLCVNLRLPCDSAVASLFPSPSSFQVLLWISFFSERVPLAVINSWKNPSNLEESTPVRSRQTGEAPPSSETAISKLERRLVDGRATVPRAGKFKQVVRQVPNLDREHVRLSVYYNHGRQRHRDARKTKSFRNWVCDAFFATYDVC